MRCHITDACEEIDAVFFSGDGFQNKTALEEIEFYVGRWSREIERIKLMLENINEE